MERCKHAPQEQAGFARLTDEALGTVMAPFPRRKQNETATEKGNERSRDRDKDRALTKNGGAVAGGETRTKIFLQIITFNLLVPFIKTNAPVHWQTLARQSNVSHVRATACVYVRTYLQLLRPAFHSLPFSSCVRCRYPYSSRLL